MDVHFKCIVSDATDRTLARTGWCLLRWRVLVAVVNASVMTPDVLYSITNYISWISLKHGMLFALFCDGNGI